MKKILALVLALALVLVTCAVAFAANDGSITVENTTDGKQYDVYKVFSATYSGNNVSYFYDGSNSTFLRNLQADSSPFTLTGPANGLYNVMVKEGRTSDVIAFIKNNEANLGTAVASKKGNGAELTFSGLDYGYYYIKSEVGAVVTIDSALKDVTLIDKNQTTTLDKQEKIANGTWKYEGIHATEDPIPTANVGDVVSYQVVGKISRYIGEDKVTKFTWTDTLSTGLTRVEDVAITVAGAAPVVAATITYDGQVATIVLPTVNGAGEFLYESNAEYVITYTAKINENAIERDEENNTVTLKYTDDNNNDHDVDNDETKVKDYKITLTKQDATTKAKLAGASFKLYDAATGGNEIPVVLVSGTGTEESTANNVYRHAKEGETGVTMVTGTTGIIEIKGLANGSYFFEEIDAPKGYNKLTARTEATTITNADATIDVDNATGTELPSTGGIGTTIFYILGGVLIVAAAVILVARKKASN